MSVSQRRMPACTAGLYSTMRSNACRWSLSSAAVRAVSGTPLPAGTAPPRRALPHGAAARTPGAKFIAGGTNLLDLMKLQIETPQHLIDVNGLDLDTIAPASDGGLRIGALVRNTDLAADARVRKDYGVLMTSGPLQGLLSRAVVVLDENGKVLYTEQVPEITQEPNYDAALAALR